MDSGAKPKTPQNGQKNKTPNQLLSGQHGVDDVTKDVTKDMAKLQMEDKDHGEPKLPPEPWQGLYYGDEIKEMISHTLKGWCSKHDHKPKIYIVTPFIDREGIKMVKDTIGDYPMTLYTREEQKQYEDYEFKDVPLKTVMNGIVSKKNFVQLRVGIHEVQNQKHYYHCKFVAAEFDDRVEILMTSANFTAQHFMHRQIDSVHNKYKVAPGVFRKEYLKKLDGYSHEYEWPTTEAASGEDKQKQQWKSPSKTPIEEVPCYKCGKKGHYATECPTATCFKCGKNGHTPNSRKCRYYGKKASKKLFEAH